MIWLSGVPKVATESDLLRLGEVIGKVKYAKIIHRRRGRAAICFSSCTDISEAARLFNGASLGDNKLRARRWGEDHSTPSASPSRSSDDDAVDQTVLAPQSLKGSAGMSVLPS